MKTFKEEHKIFQRKWDKALKVSKIKRSETERKAFIEGANWQDVGIAPSIVAWGILKDITEGRSVKAQHLESAINFFAVQLIRYSESQWGTDYMQVLDALGDISMFMRKDHAKFEKRLKQLGVKI